MGRNWKKLLKLKFWRVGWLLPVLRGNVEKKALAIRDATNGYSSSVVSAKTLYSRKIMVKDLGILFWLKSFLS